MKGEGQIKEKAERRDGENKKGSEEEKEDKAPLGQNERKRISRDQYGVIGWGQRV